MMAKKHNKVNQPDPQQWCFFFFKKKTKQKKKPPPLRSGYLQRYIL
jgi:hypothetical protein